jgi:hypothetical protein
MEIIPERIFDEAYFFKFSPCFSVKFAHFGEDFSFRVTEFPVERAFTIG